MSEAPWLQLALEIELKSATHIGTGLGLGQLIDDRIVQGPHPEYPGAIVPYIPGSTLKGRLRHHLRELAPIFEQPGVEERLLGNAEQAAALRVSDAHLSDFALVARLDPEAAVDSKQANHSRRIGTYLVRGARSFVSLSRARRVARDERLFRIELAERGLRFRSDISGRLPSSESQRDLALLCAALRELQHLGGHKGRGLGHCRLASLEIRLDGTLLDWRTLIEEQL
jgi:CRISPR/Cas system CSM-associated protein Csm3 (group 7 of RAMP superfamily)